MKKALEFYESLLVASNLEYLLILLVLLKDFKYF